MVGGQLTLNLSSGSVAFNFNPQSARELKTAINHLLSDLKAVASQVATGSRTDQHSPKPSMEYRYTGEIFLELFCNPNIWPSPFAAKLLITLRDDRIRLTTEVDLNQLVDDLNQFLDQWS
ncbi:MAG: hypothetical protein EBV05_02905 [Cyanobacteria bacterium WB6_1B_304]|jgi:hypothetical protein|nr:hypothetical protein [Cyanobacteria bacterium WB6_1B_304]